MNKDLGLVLEQCKGVVDRKIPLLVLAPEYTKILLEYIEKIQQENEKLEIENFNLREYIDIDKMSISYKNNSFEELLNMPTYKQLKERIDNATERLNTLIEFWKKYNPIDNTMQVEQFKGVINILGGKE